MWTNHTSFGDIIIWLDYCVMINMTVLMYRHFSMSIEHLPEICLFH